MTDAPSRPAPIVIVRVFLIAIAIGFNFALIGPIATRLSGAFDVGLGEVGILTTALLVSHALSQLPAAEPAQRIGPLKLVRLSFVLVTVANLVAMVSPVFWLLAVTRLVVGCGTGPVFVGGLDGTRRLGGPFLAGVFGGAATLGLGIALLVGGIYDDLGLSWRWMFGTAALLAAIAAAFGPRDSEEPRPAAGSAAEHLGAVLRSGPLWRLAMIHSASFGASLVIGAWIVTHLVDGDATTFVAGMIGLGMLGIAAVGRPVGGELAQRGIPWLLLGPASVVVCAAGLFLLALPLPTWAAALVSLLVGIGLALPFSSVFARSVAVEPRYPAAAIAFVNMSGAVFALVFTPIAGVLLDHAEGWAAFALLGVFALASAVVARDPGGLTAPRPPRATP